MVGAGIAPHSTMTLPTRRRSVESSLVGGDGAAETKSKSVL